MYVYYLAQISCCSSLDFRNYKTKMWWQIYNAACFDGLITGWDFSCFLCASHDWQLARWGVPKTLKSVMTQQSNKVTEQSWGFVITVMDYQVFAVFSTSEVSYYTDKECRKWQPLKGRNCTEDVMASTLIGMFATMLLYSTVRTILWGLTELFMFCCLHS